MRWTLPTSGRLASPANVAPDWPSVTVSFVGATPATATLPSWAVSVSAEPGLIEPARWTFPTSGRVASPASVSAWSVRVTTTLARPKPATVRLPGWAVSE